MPKRIPIRAAKVLASAFDLRQVIIFAWDGELTHCVTYGRSTEDCDQAAQGGNRIKQALGWPESLQAEPSRVKRLRAELKAARERIAELESATPAVRLGRPVVVQEESGHSYRGEVTAIEISTDGGGGGHYWTTRGEAGHG